MSNDASKPPFDTLVSLLRERSRTQPDQRGYTFLVDGEAQEEHLTFAEMDRRARALGAMLQDLGAAGKRVLLLHPPGLDYIVAFFGCLYAGAIAVPIYPPDPARLGRTLPRLLAVVNDAGATVALTTTPILSIAEMFFAEAPELRRLTWIASDALQPGAEDRWQDPAVGAETVAFLQYTSGSTSSPKGVVLTHRNLLYNLWLIFGAFGHEGGCQGVIWLPPYHDMGLIGGVLQPLYIGCNSVLLSPLDFLHRPFRWLKAISRYRGTTSGGPNFAFDLCVRKITPEERGTLDLSSWDLAFNGAEPVRPDTLRRFTEAFAPAGFNPRAFYPCYGLAEATLIVSGGVKGELPVERSLDMRALREGRVAFAPPGSPDAAGRVGSGRNLPGQRLVIAHPETGALCGPREVGEIWVAGPSVAAGYWNLPDETARAFGGTLAGSDDPTRFLRTGDLGFLDDEELFVTGRLKDLIIIRGRNHYPQDIETTVQAVHPALRSGCGAAFSVDVGDEERLVVVQEIGRTDQDAADLAARARNAVAAQHEIALHAVVLVRAGSIPKTSSGKIQRRETRAGYLAKSLDLVFEGVADDSASAGAADAADAASEAQAEVGAVEGAQGSAREALAAAADVDERRAIITAFVRAQVARVLRVPAARVDTTTPLHAFGLDSLTAIELQGEVSEGLGVAVPLAEVLRGPTIAELSLFLASASPSANPSANEMARRAPETAEATGEAPLSGGQAALWFLHQLAPESAAYSVPVVVRVRAALDAAALRRAFEVVVARHAALRTTFSMGPSGPVQHVHADAQVDFEVVDASGSTPAEAEAMVAAEARRPFDLERGPMLRVRVVGRAPDDALLLVAMHHITTDFWSMAVIAEEISALYPAAAEGGALDFLPPPATTYVAFARDQAAMLAGSRGEALAAYWREALAGGVPPLDLPLDRRRGPVQTYRGRLHTRRIPAPLTTGLKTLGRTHGATLGAVLQAAFQALLYRYSGQEDFALGVISAGRHRQDLARVVGYFANPLVVRTRPSAELRFSAYLDRTRGALSGALAHQEYPFNALVDLIQPERDHSRSPLFQVMFAYQRAGAQDARGLTAFGLDVSGARAEIGGLPIESVALPHEGSQFDLTLTMGEIGGELGASFEYNTDLFDEATIARLADHFEILLAGVVADPDRPLGDLPLLGEAERRFLLNECQGPRAAIPTGETVVTRFAAQAARAPDRVAAVFRGEEVRYGALAARVEALAARLRDGGVGPGSMVAICLHRSVETIVATLGVLYTGAAYVPIEPGSPAERLAFLIGDAGAGTLITEASLLPRLGGLDGVEVITLEGGAGEARRAGPVAVGHRDLACVIYTSGSTGQPKGVMLEHGGLLNLVASFQASYEADERDRILPITSVASASFVGELFPLLCAGGAVVLPDEEEAVDVEAILGLADRAGVTILSTVPAVLAGLDARCEEMRLPRVVLSGGEALGLHDVARLAARTTVVNGYGLTETTVCSTYFRVRPEAIGEGEAFLPVGHPIINTDAHVLDAQGGLLPLGCPGELYVGGAGLARGYWRRPDLTAARFVPDPFRPGERLYRTGDVVRRRADGAITYLHRADAQIKIRGHRVEPGEIEAALRAQPGVVEAFVTARGEPAERRRLVAYVVLADPAPAAADLREAIASRLPPHMVPADFVQIAALPLTANGKVDERALPAPEADRAAMRGAFAPPQSELERRIAACFQQVLKVAEVGLHDNFFELGGNSLLLAQAHRAIKQELGVELSLVDLFKHTTVGALAKHLGGPPPEAAADQRLKDEGQRRRDALRGRREAAMARRNKPKPGGGDR